MFEEQDEEVFGELEAAQKLGMNLVHGVEEDEESRGGDGRPVVRDGQGGRRRVARLRVAGAKVAGGERVAGLYPFPLDQRFKPLREEDQ